MKIRKGLKVKIPDIGSLATVIQPGRHMAMVELDGERFWMPVDLLEVIKEVT